MPRRGERVQRSKPPARSVAPTRQDHVGIRVARDRSRASGSVHSVNPVKFRCSTLVAQLADEWVAYTRRAALTSPGRHAQAIREFGAFVDVYAAGRGLDPARVRLDSTEFDLPEVIDEWEISLRNNKPASSTLPYSLVSTLLLLLRERAARDSSVPSALRARAAAPPLFKQVSTQPLDEFSNAERLAVETAARNDLRQLEQRLKQGQRLLDQGRDPRTVAEGWFELPNLVWAAHAGILSVKALKAELPRRLAQWPPSLRDLLPGDVRPGTDSLMRTVGQLLFPGELDLHPFRVLLLLGMTECTPEELHALRLSDIEFTDGGVRLVQAKQRAHRIRTHLHADQPATADDGEPDEGLSPGFVYEGTGRWDVPGLLRRLIAATELTRSCFQTEPLLWIAVEARNHRTELIADFARFKLIGRRFTHWIASHADDDPPLVVSEPHNVLRLRKTAKTSRVIALGGTLTDLAGKDHSIEVFRGHYAHGTTAHVLSAKAVNRAQEKVFRRVSGTPLFIDTDAEAVLERPEVAEAAGMTVDKAAAMRAGDLDMGVTNCRNPYDSDFTPGGKFCHVAPAMCMLCRNAVVFTSHLPRLLLLFDHLEYSRRNLDPPRWEATWGKQHRALTQLFTEVGEEGITKARQQIVDENLTLDLPLGMRTEYDR